MEVETRIVAPVEPPQEGEELLVAVAGVALADDRPPEQVERGEPGDRKSTRLNSSHSCASRMPSSAGKKKKSSITRQLYLCHNHIHEATSPTHTPKYTEY